MAEKRTTYKIQDLGGIGEVQIADEVVAIIAGLAATEVDKGYCAGRCSNSRSESEYRIRKEHSGNQQEGPGEGEIIHREYDRS